MQIVIGMTQASAWRGLSPAPVNAVLQISKAAGLEATYDLSGHCHRSLVVM